VEFTLHLEGPRDFLRAVTGQFCVRYRQYDDRSGSEEMKGA